MKKLPEHYRRLQNDYPDVLRALENLGQAVRKAGPLAEKNVQLIQLASSVSMRSEGGVRSHARRALQAEATPEEITQAILVLAGPLGFSHVAAALDWVRPVLEDAK